MDPINSKSIVKSNLCKNTRNLILKPQLTSRNIAIQGKNQSNLMKSKNTLLPKKAIQISKSNLVLKNTTTKEHSTPKSRILNPKLNKNTNNSFKRKINNNKNEHLLSGDGIKYNISSICMAENVTVIKNKLGLNKSNDVKTINSLKDFEKHTGNVSVKEVRKIYLKKIKDQFESESLNNQQNKSVNKQLLTPAYPNTTQNNQVDSKWNENLTQLIVNLFESFSESLINSFGNIYKKWNYNQQESMNVILQTDEIKKYIKEKHSYNNIKDEILNKNDSSKINNNFETNIKEKDLKYKDNKINGSSLVKTTKIIFKYNGVSIKSLSLNDIRLYYDQLQNELSKDITSYMSNYCKEGVSSY